MSIARYVSTEGRLLKFTNLEKIFYPETGFTKGDVIRYYRRISPVLLPHLKNRPFTLRRFPSGVEGDSFYEKQCPFHHPRWVKTHLFDDVNYCLIDDLPTLLWAVNLAAIELHTTLATIADMQCPTFLVFDLDPGEGANLSECANVALLLKKELELDGLEAFAKTSGQKGLHLQVPLNTATTYGETKTYAHRLAKKLELRYPSRIVSRMPKSLRAGKVFIDWSQNADFKTTVTAYSLRANTQPTVSTPLLWKEVHQASRKSWAGKRLLSLGPKDIISRIERYGDLLGPVLTLKQAIPRGLGQGVKFSVK